MLGHDMRAAISDILGGLALSDLSALDPDSRRQLQRVESAAEQLARLTDETLALVTGDATERGGTEAETRLEPFLARVSARWQAHAQERGLRFELERGTDLPKAIGTDRAALERIVANLLSNAMKYSPCGTVRMRVQMGPKEALCFRVRDTGPGFSDAAMSQLFEFAGRPANSVQPGTGLGLHIVRELAQRIRGQLRVINLDDGGAEVSLCLPRAAWAPGVLAPDALDDLPDLTGLDVLLAEDNETNQLLIRQMLETLGATCTLVSDGQAAVDALERRCYSLVLIDIEMPRLSGIDVIRKLRAGERPGEAIPVLAVTAFVLSANRDEIYAAGADGILAKPILSLEAFGEAISRVLRKHSGGCCATDPVEDTPFDRVHLDRLLALAGPDDGCELLTRMREDFDTVRRGLEEGCARRDMSLLRGRTHVLISLAGAVGNSNLQIRAEELNAAARGQLEVDVTLLCPTVIAKVGALCTALTEELDMRYGEAVA